jgi:Helix-turn-helix domain of resolvase
MKLSARRAVDANGCWIWLGAKNRDGYGEQWWDGRLRSVHRLSAHLLLGLDLNTKLCVLHSCDTPACFNPDHLRTGTQAENILDATLKGRMGKKLRREGVIEIRRLLDRGQSRKAIADRFGVSTQTIGQIASGQTWKYISLAEPDEGELALAA